MSKIGVAVLGASGAVGQRFVALLANHPWFELRALVGNEGAGKSYAAATAWMLDGPMPEEVAAMPVETLQQFLGRRDVQAVFSAMPSGVAGPIESDLARRGLKVFTNASDHRMDPEVPLLIPEVNAEAIDRVAQQGKGWIVANGNCTAILLTLAVAPLHHAFGVDELHVTSLQALSGAGYPGVPALDVADNVLPFIRGEEQKLETEPNKMLGTQIPIHATCTRVAVREGHLESVHLRLGRATNLAEVKAILAGFRGSAQVQGLPSAPRRPIHLLAEEDRPQPRRDRDLEGGMALAVGRVRLDADGRGLRFVLLGSNTIRGAAGASLLNAELAKVRGLL